MQIPGAAAFTRRRRLADRRHRTNTARSVNRPRLDEAVATPGRLVITEPVAIPPAGAGHGAACLATSPRPMGMFAPADLAEWRRVTAAVYATDGAIVAQIWHGGWLAHCRHGASGIPAGCMVRSADGSLRPAGPPQRLSTRLFS